MISGRDIANFRIRLLQAKAREVTGPFGEETIRMFYEAFSEDIGELLAMADAFRKIHEPIAKSGVAETEHILRCVHEFEELAWKR